MPEESLRRVRKRPRSLDPVADREEIELRRQEHQKQTEEIPLQPKLTDEDRINCAKSNLRHHLGIGQDGAERSQRSTVLFFVEIGPGRNGSACQLPTCDKRISEGSYRIAVFPGVNWYKNPGKTKLHKIPLYNVD
jgi:hypothetical protein